MDVLNIDFSPFIPNISDAFVQVYGEEFKEIIDKRINNIQYVIYRNAKGINSYYRFLCTCKQQELSLDFLKRIGIDVSYYEGKSYAESLNEEIDHLIDEYLGGVPLSFNPHFINFPFGIKSFKDMKGEVNESVLLRRQLNFLNFFRGEDKEKLTLDTIKAFEQTEEYEIINKKINEYLMIYKELLEKYLQYLKTIEKYKKYSDGEKERLQKILNMKKIELYQDLIPYLPRSIRKYLDSHCTNEQEKTEKLFSRGEIEDELCIEYFSKKYEDQLKSPSLDESEKEMIYYCRLKFFQSLGIDLDPWVEKQRYHQVIKRKTIKSLIPNFNFIIAFTMLREMKYKEAIREFIFSSDTFINNAKKFQDNENNQEAIYSRIKDNSVCITGGDDGKNFTPILFYTAGIETGGKLDYLFLHELVHAIESKAIDERNYTTGFDLNGNSKRNPYNLIKREYERMNEVFTDLIAIETRKILHQSGIYFADDPLHTIYDVEDYNTHHLLKEMVKPLFQEFRSQILRARLLGKIDEIFACIGEENYERLNDLVNKVDFLLGQGLYSKLVKHEDDHPLVIEYNYQLKRLEQIYDDIHMRCLRDINNFQKQKRHI